jgi:hypothetical protein
MFSRSVLLLFAVVSGTRVAAAVVNAVWADVECSECDIGHCCTRSSSANADVALIACSSSSSTACTVLAFTLPLLVMVPAVWHPVVNRLRRHRSAADLVVLALLTLISNSNKGRGRRVTFF